MISQITHITSGREHDGEGKGVVDFAWVRGEAPELVPVIRDKAA